MCTMSIAMGQMVNDMKSMADVLQEIKQNQKDHAKKYENQITKSSGSENNNKKLWNPAQVLRQK